MVLKVFLQYIVDEDVRLELEIDTEGARDYSFLSFWLSDFRQGIRFGREHPLDYSNWIVERISFIPVMDNSVSMTITVKQP